MTSGTSPARLHTAASAVYLRSRIAETVLNGE